MQAPLSYVAALSLARMRNNNKQIVGRGIWFNILWLELFSLHVDFPTTANGRVADESFPSCAATDANISAVNTNIFNILCIRMTKSVRHHILPRLWAYFRSFPLLARDRILR